jgi:hypothetical protein
MALFVTYLGGYGVDGAEAKRPYTGPMPKVDWLNIPLTSVVKYGTFIVSHAADWLGLTCPRSRGRSKVPILRVTHSRYTRTSQARITHRQLVKHYTASDYWLFLVTWIGLASWLQTPLFRTLWSDVTMKCFVPNKSISVWKIVSINGKTLKNSQVVRWTLKCFLTLGRRL